MKRTQLSKSLILVSMIISIIIVSSITWNSYHAISDTNNPFQFTITKTLFFDDFEDDAVGSLPDGWVVHWGGDQYGVSTAHAYSGSKSLMLKGTYGWSCVLARPFSSNARYLGFDATVYIGNPETTNCPLKGCMEVPVTLGCYECRGEWGDGWISLRFNFTDNYIYVEDYHSNADPSARHFTKLVPFQRNTWIKIRIVLDRDNALYYIWVNDNLIASGVPVVDFREYNKYTYLIDRFIAGSGWSGATIYIDDVRVFEASLPESTVTQSFTKTTTLTYTLTVTRTVTTTNPFTTTRTLTETRTVTSLSTTTQVFTQTVTKTEYRESVTLYSTITLTSTETSTLTSTYTSTHTLTVEKEARVSDETVAMSVLLVGISAVISLALLRR